MLYLAVICFALVALLAYREWVGVRERRERMAAAERERAAFQQERAALLLRIQAPETAVLEQVRKERGEHRPRRPIGADDDKRFAARNQGVKGA